MLKLATILLALIAASEQAESPRAGIMVTTADHGVLAMDGPTLAPGTLITLVTIDNPQQVSWAVIADRLKDSEMITTLRSGKRMCRRKSRGRSQGSIDKQIE